MDAWVWVLIVAAVIFVVLAAVAVTRGRQRKLDTKRGEAGALRERAEMRSAQAERREAAAEEQTRQAERWMQEAQHEREVAQATAQRADDVDPDVKT
jgi:F0F1-type ATP synthase membrane subunit b/b'